MNRHERRAAKKRGATFGTMTMSPEELLSKGWGCAWHGCTASYRGDMPEGWRRLLVWWSARPDIHRTAGDIAMSDKCDRDGALCPEHADELDALLVELPSRRLVSEPSAGTA